jgi:peptidoglycan/xylan/chitin deacetylase (PgdA/CDA1 family)
MPSDFAYSTSLKEVIPNLLDFFERHNVRATFFVLGSLAEKNPALVKKIAKKHEIASHSYDHVDFSKLNENETAVQVIKSKKAFDLLGINVRGFRAPFFKTNKFLYKYRK